jgi:hypothetical protein
MSAAQYDRQLSLTVSEPVFSRASSQTVTNSDSGVTTTFGYAPEAGATTIEFGLQTPGSTAVKSGTRPSAGFDIHFTVRRGDVSTPNSADIRIYNLNPDTANAIGTREFKRVTLKAGYPGNFGLVFTGEIKQTRIGRESATDTYVDLGCADGDSAYNYSALALTLAAGSKPADAIQAFLKEMARGGIIKGYVPDVPSSGSGRNRVYWGMLKDEMREFAESQGVLCSVQDGKFTVIPLQSYIPGTAIVISPTTGLLDTPEQTQNGIECRVLLNPQIKIGQLVELKNTTIDRLRYGLDIGSQGSNYLLSQTVKLNAAGMYYVMTADHIGQTRGPAWETKLTLLAVDAQIPREQVPRGSVATADAIARN